MDFTDKTPGWGRNGEATCRSSQLHRHLSLPSPSSNFPYYLFPSLTTNQPQMQQQKKTTTIPPLPPKEKPSKNQNQTKTQSKTGAFQPSKEITAFYYHRNKQKPPQVSCFPSKYCWIEDQRAHHSIGNISTSLVYFIAININKESL